ncbi:MAG: aromatic amino acid lyase [Thermodesulfobacteriota bacterium]|nr:aromatic amino acid lyase [Thermodesulfobacteriota bacterium]
MGASGDLAPLAHIATVLTRDIGDGDGGYSGQARYKGELLSRAEAMKRVGISRVAPRAKEGLAVYERKDLEIQRQAQMCFQIKGLTDSNLFFKHYYDIAFNKS